MAQAVTRSLSVSELLSLMLLQHPRPVTEYNFDACCDALGARMSNTYSKITLLREKDYIQYCSVDWSWRAAYAMNEEKLSDILGRTKLELFDRCARGCSGRFNFNAQHVAWLRALIDFRQNGTLPEPVIFSVTQLWKAYFEEYGPTWALLPLQDPAWLTCFEQAPVFLADAVYKGFVNRVIVSEIGLETGAESISPLRRYLEAHLRGFYTPDEYSLVNQQLVFYEEFLHKGQPAEVLKKLPAGSKYAYVVGAVGAMSDGQDPSVAVDLMRKALACEGKKRYFEEPVLNWYYGVALLRDRDDPAAVKKMASISGIKAVKENPELAPLWLLTSIGSSQELPETLRHKAMRLMKGEKLSASAGLFIIAAFANRYLGDDGDGPLEPYAQSFFNRFPIFLVEFMRIKNRTCKEFDRDCSAFGLNPILPVIEQKAPWEKKLERLLALAKTNTPKKKATGTRTSASRIAYYLNRKDFTLTMRLQKSKDDVTWTTGNDMTLSAFKKGHDCMTDQDQAVRSCVDLVPGYTARLQISVFGAMFALVGSSNVYDAANESQRLEIRREPLQIEVIKTDEGFVFTTNLPNDFNPNWGNKAVNTERPDNVVTVFEMDANEMTLLKELYGEKAFPPEAEKQIKTYLQELSRTTPVMSDLLATTTAMAHQKADSRIVLQIQPEINGRYSVTASVRPAAEGAVVCVPGQGIDHLAVAVKGQTVQLDRNRKEELANWERISDELASQGLDDCRDGEWSWLPDLAGCLTVLETARKLPDVCIAEWPRGAKFTVGYAMLDTNALKLSVRSIGQWFEVEGRVQSSAKAKMTVNELLQKIREAKGNFIALTDDQYVAITEAFKKQLAQLDALTVNDKGKALKVSKFSAERLEDLGENGIKLDVDEGFKNLTARIKESAAADIRVPVGLKAELRDYQVDGFEWLSRLAGWGAGALLADDMGLGKTIQTMALLLARAKEGPALVVTPTAVTGNWVDELRRFAPGLNPMVYGHETKAARAKLIGKAKANDVVLVTYGVLTSDIEEFAKRTWATAVLDEAHAVKNRDTKMSKAVMQLKADARVLLTGTPLQNRLSELWNLFEFANPGLLGSYDAFCEDYVLPIEKHKDKERQRQLKRLISPFILRRTKAEVLDELPEKTEITLKVKLSDEETALYESLRKEAEASLEAGDINPIEALAQLLKLRQAACSPALVDDGLKGIASSKTQFFIDLVDELIEGGHRALVFSQFTSHLALIKEALDAKGIEYLYLDGSMTGTQRTKLVEAFQTGEMPLFLISLKAGGTGLNLTAADYVIHLDPWWNPAIEDQASDRAYRIGQENPVTIYRLIAENTIEEKIIKLHETKKSLADALLEGTDMANRLSREEILKLLSE